MLHQRSTRLFLFLGGFFIANAIIAEFIGVKIFALEATLGWQPFEWHLFGVTGTLQFTCGVILWPFVFILTDIINEYFGQRGVRFLSYLTAGLISYAFAMVYLAMVMSPADWWTTSNTANGVPNMQNAFAAIFGQGMWIIIASLVAFMLSQLLDVYIFHWVKQRTGERYLWLRATGSTLVSQLIDSFVVLYIAFVLGPQHWSVERFLAIAIVNYCYKFLAAFALTPLVYAIHYAVEAYLGEHLSEKLKKGAIGEE